MLAFVRELLLDLRSYGLPGPKQNLQAHVRDPAWLTVGSSDGLEAPSGHQQQVQRLGVVERLPSAKS